MRTQDCRKLKIKKVNEAASSSGGHPAGEAAVLPGEAGNTGGVEPGRTGPTRDGTPGGTGDHATAQPGQPTRRIWPIFQKPAREPD
eukprot:2471843-Amphidinium_carterae.1